MAKHRSPFFTKALIGMGAVTGLTVMMSTPAHAETIGLICNYANVDLHVSVDTDRQSVVQSSENGQRGPFAASISDTLIQWRDGGPAAGYENRYTIDRVAGTIREIATYRGKFAADWRGKCRRATQKF